MTGFATVPTVKCSQICALTTKGTSRPQGFRAVEEITRCHSSPSVKRSPQINLGSIRFPVGSMNGRRTRVQLFCSSGLPQPLQNSLFSVVQRRFRKEHLSKPEVRQALRRLNLTLRRFRSWLRAETDSSSLLTRLAVSHRQLMVSLSSTRSEDFDDGDIQRNTYRALQSRSTKTLRHKRQPSSASVGWGAGAFDRSL